MEGSSQAKIVTYLFTFILLFNASLGYSVQAATIAGVKFPENIELQGATLKLNGVALKEATFFRIDVYVVGLYLEQKASQKDVIYASKGSKLVRIQFLLNVNKDRLAKSWVSDLNEACNGECINVVEEAKRLAQYLPHIKRGDSIDYEIHEDEVIVRVNTTEVGTLRETGSHKAVLSAFIGDYSPRDLRQALLGQSL